jgi:hypothetical protein
MLLGWGTMGELVTLLRAEWLMRSKSLLTSAGCCFVHSSPSPCARLAITAFARE